MSRLIDLIGQRFGRLKVIERRSNGPAGQPRWLCKCNCGNKIIVSGSSIRNGHTKSCGCYRKELMTTHGQTEKGNRPSVYTVWIAMKGRCNNPKDKGYRYYGGRGITVCKEWFKFENFFADMGEKPEGLTLERIDNNSNYEPDNCKWATQSEQMRNTRRNHLVEYKGKTMCVADWANKLGLSYQLLHKRLKRHPPEIAFNM